MSFPARTRSMLGMFTNIPNKLQSVFSLQLSDTSVTASVIIAITTQHFQGYSVSLPHC